MTVPQLTTARAELLAPAQAAELLQVIEHQIAWELTKDEPGRTSVPYTMAQLRARQTAFEAYRKRLDAYIARYRNQFTPEVSASVPARLGSWSRTVRAVLRRAEPKAYPVNAMGKTYRVADRVAERFRCPPVERPATSQTPEDAIRDLEAVLAWCDKVSVATAVRRPSPQGEAEVRPEVG